MNNYICLVEINAWMHTEYKTAWRGNVAIASNLASLESFAQQVVNDAHRQFDEENPNFGVVRHAVITNVIKL